MSGPHDVSVTFFFQSIIVSTYLTGKHACVLTSLFVLLNKHSKVKISLLKSNET